MRTIELVVSPDGASKVETKGFAGSTCIEASRFLERTLGRKQQEHLTADFYRQNVSQSQQAREQQ